jgi:hypothetical protein
VQVRPARNIAQLLRANVRERFFEPFWEFWDGAGRARYRRRAARAMLS